MSRTLFGPTAGGMAQPIKPLVPQRLGLPMQGRGRPGGSPVPKIGPAFSRPSGLQMFSAGGPVDMGSIMPIDAMHSMPGRSVPDYLMARMSDGGDPPPIHPMVERARARISEERNRPRWRPQADELDMEELRSMLRPDREASFMKSRQPDARERQRAALFDMYNAGPLQKAEQEESRAGWHDMAAGFADPTSMPMNFSGAGILPKLSRGLLRKMPSHGFFSRPNAAVMGAWNTSGSSIGDLMGAEHGERPWMMDELPESTPLIGAR